MGLRISYFLQDGAVNIRINLLSSLHTLLGAILKGDISCLTPLNSECAHLAATASRGRVSSKLTRLPVKRDR